MKIIYFIFFILVLLISRGKSNDVLGPIFCSYYGAVDYYCNEEIVPPKELPVECTSFLWDGMTLGSKKSLFDYAVLGLIADVDKPIIIDVRHGDFGKYFDYVKDGIAEQAVKDIDYIQTFSKNTTKIKGILFEDIDLSTTTDFKKFGDNLKTYLNKLKEKLSGLIIGVALTAGAIIDKFSTANGGLELTTFDQQVDFYVVKFDLFNPCKPDIVKGGIIPKCGNQPNTLDKLKQALGNLKLPKDKIYFKYELYAVNATTTEISYTQQCFSSFNMMCKSPDNSKDWCADTSSTLAEKGQFAKDNGGGILFDSIDLDDVTSACKCNKKFPAFNYILDGWNGQKPVACPIFDKSG